MIFPYFSRWCFALPLFCFALIGHDLLAQTRHTLSGYVSDAQSGEKLIGVTIFDKTSGLGAVTNTFGFFSLTLPATDSARLAVSYIGYQTNRQSVALTGNPSLDLRLTQMATLQEVEVVADRYERVEERVQMSRIDVPIEQIKKVPALLGEKDVLRALQLLPGVSGGGEGQSGLYVRGGGPDQNLILLDGVPVYNASHLFGFFSVFNPDAIKDVSLVKGGFPARYGGRLSSVIEINLKEGNDQAFHGEGSIGLVASKLTLEGPIQKGKSSFIISGRRTYIDLLARPIIKSALRSNGQDGVIGYFFDDINAKVNYRFSPKDRLYLSVYTGRDRFYSEVTDNSDFYKGTYENGLDWGNRTGALRWNHVLGPKLFANTTLTYSRYNFGTDLGFDERSLNGDNSIQSESTAKLTYQSGITDLAFKIDLDYVPNPQHYLRFGANVIRHNFRPGAFRSGFRDVEVGIDTTTSENNYIEPDINSTELAAYIEDDWTINSRLRINAGVHFSGFVVKGNTYASAQPRFNMRYLFNGGWSAKASFNTMRQYVHLLTNENIGLPTDLWLPTTDKIRPQDAWQTAIGAAKTFGKDYEASVEVFYKKMYGVTAYREGSSLLQFQNWESRIAQGQGEAYGAEWFIQKKRGRFNGWVGYTLSWAWRKFDDINFGRQYPYKFDRRHDLEITGSYQFNKRISLSATWVYSTGNAVTFGNSRHLAPAPYYSQTGNRNPLSVFSETTHTPERNNFRLRPYHRFDVGIDFTKQKKRHTRTWSFGAYNAYSRANPFYIYLSSESTKLPNGTFESRTTLRQAALFPIIPYFNYSFKF
jgi:TonB-dependent Receptor Plug Domain/CarboxypepD_reg-like domain/TonB dependent receptor